MRSRTGRVRRNRKPWMNGSRWWKRCYLSPSWPPKEASSLSFPFVPPSLKDKGKGHKVGTGNSMIKITLLQGNMEAQECVELSWTGSNRFRPSGRCRSTLQVLWSWQTLTGKFWAQQSPLPTVSPLASYNAPAPYYQSPKRVGWECGQAGSGESV